MEDEAKKKARAERFGLEGGEEDARRKDRAERFGLDPGAGGDGLMDVDALEARRDAPLTIARRPEAVHLYGVDLMSTSDCLSYFSEWGPRYIEWLEDSSCNVVFADAHTAARAIVGRGAPLPPDSASAPDTAGLDPTNLASAPYLWHQGPDFVKRGTGLPLLYRMAVVTDVKPPGGGKMSRRLWRLPAAAALDAVGKGDGRRRRGGDSGGDGPRGDVAKRSGRRRGRRVDGDVEMKMKGE